MDICVLKIVRGLLEVQITAENQPYKRESGVTSLQFEFDFN